MKTLQLTTALLLASSLSLASCGGAPSADTPDGAVMAGVHALRKNDLEGFLRHAFTAEQVSEMRADWGTQRMKKSDPKEDAEFAAKMAMITAKDAEKTLMAMVEPALKEMKPQVDMMFGMLEGMAGMAMESNDELSSAEKQQATQAMQAIITTLKQNDVTDVGRARKAVGILCKTARKLDVATLDDVRALSFEGLLGKGDHALAGFKDVLEVYGFSIDSMLNSVEAETISQSGDSATVKVTYTIAGTTHSQENEMVRMAGRWVAKREDEASGPAEIQSGFSAGN